MEAKKFDQTEFGSLSTKQIEKLGTDAFKDKMISLYGDKCDIKNIENKGKASNKPKVDEKSPGCDLVLSMDGIIYYIELKTSGNPKLPTNIRFTHQTISKMTDPYILKDLIVVCVYNLKEGKDKAKYKFFKFGEIDDIKVEPHFIIQSRNLPKDSESDDDSFEKSFNEVRKATKISGELSYEKLFNTKVRDHMYLLKKNSH